MNKTLRLISAVAIACALLTPASASSENALGVRGGYNSRTSSAIAGLWFQHTFQSWLRVSPNVDYMFKHGGTDAVDFNCNVHFPFSFAADCHWSFYPLAGLNYTSWNFRDSIYDEDEHFQTPEGVHFDDVTSRHNRFGINAGAGLEVKVSPTLKLALEAKGTLVKKYSSATFTLAIGYVF